MIRTSAHAAFSFVGSPLKRSVHGAPGRRRAYRKPNTRDSRPIFLETEWISPTERAEKSPRFRKSISFLPLTRKRRGRSRGRGGGSGESAREPTGRRSLAPMVANNRQCQVISLAVTAIAATDRDREWAAAAAEGGGCRSVTKAAGEGRGQSAVSSGSVGRPDSEA